MKKRSKILAAAIALMSFSTAASITGTVAWFTAANTVSVEGMSIKAEAEEGIVIAQESASTLTDASWKTSVSALHTGADKTFIPTTTKALDKSTGWKHANVDSADSATSGAVYQDFTITPATIGTAASVATGTTETQVSTAKNVYLYNEFYIQAAAPADMANQNIYIKSVTATESGTAQDLNKSLRVAFKLDSEVKVYAPLLGSNFAGTTYAYAAPSATQSGTTPNSADYVLTNDTIPAYTPAGTNKLVLEVYCWFDGEDANCKSANIAASLNNIAVEFVLGNIKTA